MPLGVAYDFGVRFLEVETTTCDDDEPHDNNPGTSNAFTLLMNMSRNYSKLPDKRKESTGKDKIYNAVLADLDKQNVKFTLQQVGTLGKHVVSELTNILWELDPHHEAFSTRACHIPEMFQKYTGYNDYKSKHKRKPQLSSTILQEAAEKLAKLLMLPYFLADRCKEFRGELETFQESVVKMKDYLEKANVRAKVKNASTEPVRGFTDNFAFSIKEAVKSEIPECYAKLASVCEKLEPYKYIDLIDFEPVDAIERRKWFSKLQLPFDFGLFVYSHGNNLGNVNILWKQPPDDQKSTELDMKCLNELKKDIPVYATRAMRKEFIEQYNRTTKLKPMIARSMFRYLTNTELTSENHVKQKIDERLDLLMKLDDPKLIMDLRANNGKIEDPKYDVFWKELGCLLDETSVVNDRRKPTAQYMPIAISVNDLRDQVLKRLPEGTEAPSRSWIHLNFQPRNPFVKSALQYTGKFEVKRCVQQRILRAQHPDADYTYTQYRYLKEFAVENKDNVQMQCLDDKAIVPIGEPGKPTSATQRRHNASLTTPGKETLALDHDYHLCGIVPSVCLVVDIPDTPKGSFYKGNVHITVKDKVLQASSPIRHSTETVAIMRQHYREDLVNLNKPILLRYTDGGPDHRTNFPSVQLSAILEFIALDLDLLIACRTAPNQSYNNPAERVMSLLNLGLQNVALSRTEMLPGLEMQIRSMNSLKLFRRKASDKLKDALVESLNEPIGAVKKVFSRLKRKSGSVLVHDACTEEDMSELKRLGSIIKPGVDFENKNTVQDVHVAAFIDKHCRKRHYSFQIKKCAVGDQEACPYCSLNPPRLADDVFSRLSFLPDPVLNEKGEYKEFAEVYGTPTDEKDMPSRKQKAVSTDRDKRFKSLLVAEKVRGFVICHDCGKRRVIYSSCKFNQQQLQSVQILQDELLYSCGATLFPGGTYQDVIIVREGLNCSSHMETQYYSGKTEVFDEVCFYCGDTDDLEDTTQLRNEYNIVRPICTDCSINQGYKPSTRSAKKLKK